MTMTDSTFTAAAATPFDTDQVLYHLIESAGIPSGRAWQFSGWKAESMSWKTGCYIRAGLSSTAPLSLKGPDALKFLEAEVAHPKRTVVTLRGNPEDVIDIYAALLRPGEEYKTLDLPYAPNVWPQARADHILKDGRSVGISSGTSYSYYFREVLSMGCIDNGRSEIGTEVIVNWGDYGGRIKNVRATVARFPYLTEGRNSDLDVTSFE
jgi:glycine cleavage system aminomethyltransferase T